MEGRVMAFIIWAIVGALFQRSVIGFINPEMRRVHRKLVLIGGKDLKIYSRILMVRTSGLNGILKCNRL